MKTIELAVGEKLAIKLEDIRVPIEGVVSSITVEDMSSCRDYVCSLEVIIRFVPGLPQHTQEQPCPQS